MACVTSLLTEQVNGIMRGNVGTYERKRSGSCKPDTAGYEIPS